MSEAEYSLGRHCGITFAGLKPASLFWVHQKHLTEIEHYSRCFALKGFTFTILKYSDEKALLFIFHEEKLKKVLFQADVFAFLQMYGYKFADLHQAIAQLRRRLQGSDAFPHEIGVFLGYPLADVRGFIQNAHGGYTIEGYWKVYEDPEAKAKLFAQFRRCSACICKKLRQGISLEAIFHLASDVQY